MKIRIAMLGLLAGGAVLAEDTDLKRGEAIYRKLCVDCHGPMGRGVPGECDDPLEGDWSVEKLARIIHKSMPEDEEQLCVDREAELVARFIHQAFYSPEARVRLRPARIDFSRLTVRQTEESLADLIGGFAPARRPERTGGLRGEYSKTRGFGGAAKNRAFERTDAQVRFDFGEGSPDPKIGAKEFSIRWRGSVLPEETGEHEFVVTTENGFRLYVNDREEPLIDGWVSSGPEPREQRATVRLLGGRAYPVLLEYFKYKDKTASVSLAWKPPHQTQRVIPARNLSPDSVPPTFVVTTPFPPDDGSVGYARGTAVSREWTRAAALAAVETAEAVSRHQNALARTRAGEPRDQQAGKLRDFCGKVAERAFRRPLDPAERARIVDARFRESEDPTEATERCLIHVLSSPRFLYPDLAAGGGAPDAHTVAARLALGLWDSLPDEPLRQAAAKGQLRTPEQVARQAQRMLRDPRARAKVRHFFRHWLRMDEVEDIAKDSAMFPDFTPEIVADLRTSLLLFVDDVFWSGDSDYRQLLLAGSMWLNRDLAEYYGVDPKPETFARVAFHPERRSGVVTHPYLLSVLAYHNSSSPIHRGVFATRNLLGRSLKPPPEATEFVDSRFDPTMSMREKVTDLTKPANCMTCHAVINPLGFSLEHFDAVGRFRTHERGREIDAAGELPTDDGGKVPLRGARDLAKYAAESEQAQRAFVIQLFNQVAKQPVQAYGPEALDELHRGFAEDGFNMQRLLVRVATRAALRD